MRLEYQHISTHQGLESLGLIPYRPLQRSSPPPMDLTCAILAALGPKA